MSSFPLCSEARHEAAIRHVLEGCVRFVRERLSPPTLVGVVLTGSFARGEGSVLSVDGHLKVLGDIEFFVVLAHGRDYRRLRPAMAAWGPRAAAMAAADGVRADFEFGPVPLSYLRRPGPSIFVYDLRHHGKVLWGPESLLDDMPPLRAEDIPREHALRLLLNRTIEQLEAYDRIDGLAGDALLDVAYQRLKIVLDLAGSALAFSGLHTPFYADRPRALARLLRETPSLARRLPSDFESELARATRLKLAPDDYGFAARARQSLAAQRQAMRAQIVAAVPAMTGLLEWELAQLLDGGGRSLDALLDRYLASQPLARRVWDWTKLFATPLPAPLPLSVGAAARLFWRSTPRALIYAAGTRAYRALAEPFRAPDPAGRSLPVKREPGGDDAEARRRAIVALWRWGVRNS